MIMIALMSSPHSGKKSCSVLASAQTQMTGGRSRMLSLVTKKLATTYVLLGPKAKSVQLHKI